MTPASAPEFPIFSRAKWIWPVSPNWDIHNSYALFRTGFKLAAIPKRAPLFITADQSYRLYINGHFAATGPARGFQTNWPYDEIDLHQYLKIGYNQIAIRAYNPGFSNFQYLCQSWAGLLVAAKWGKTEINSGPLWKSIRQIGIRSDTVATSLQLFPQEHIDLRKTPCDWMEPGFDDCSWESPVAREFNAAPWFSLEKRGIPMLETRAMSPAALLGIGEGQSASGYPDTRDVVALRQHENRSHQPAEGLPFTPLAVRPTGVGRFRSFLFDFKRTVVGYPQFSIQGARGGEIIDSHFSETIDSATLTPDQVIPSHSRMAFGDRMILRSGTNQHTFYHAYGFRFLMITVRDTEADLAIELGVEWIGYPLPRKGSFSSSDTELARIWEACAWTQQCCSLDAYVDTPWREQAQWWGDARVQAWNTFHLNGDTRLFERGIRQIGQQTTPDGVTYGHAPTMAHNCILPDFTIIWFLTLWDIYWQTGSTAALEENLPVVERALDYFRDHTDPATGLVGYDDRFWLFLDWTDLFKDGAPAVYNLWLLIALEKLALMHRKSGQPSKAAPLSAWAKRLRTALEKLINSDGLMRDGIDRKGNMVPETSIHAQTLALAAGIHGLDTEAAFTHIIIPWIKGASTPQATPSAYWVTYVFTALIENGYAPEVIAFIRKHWNAMADHGTTWENFAPKRGDESHSHAWSAHPLYHLMQTIGGITQSDAAWSQVNFRPVFHGSHGGAIVPTPHGKISSSWRKQKNGAIRISLNLPSGITASILVDGLKRESVTGKFSALVPSPSEG